jgi:hypothetical protein
MLVVASWERSLLISILVGERIVTTSVGFLSGFISGKKYSSSISGFWKIHIKGLYSLPRRTSAPGRKATIEAKSENECFLPSSKLPLTARSGPSYTDFTCLASRTVQQNPFAQTAAIVNAISINCFSARLQPNIPENLRN